MRTQYFNYLKNVFLFYLISGAALGIAIFSLITVHSYNDYMVNALEVAKNISSNKDKVKDQIYKMKTGVKYLKEDLKLDAIDIYSERPFYQTLDGIKTNMKNAVITIDNFKEVEREKALPVQILVPVKDYKMVVDYTGYVESLNIPKFKINYFSVSKGPSGDVVLSIRGDLSAPFGKGPDEH